ncbi:MAG TPA: hypothetical protein VMT73_11850 [Anaerolineales bacterium]|nr:hypothetical protein [Anaerolineales bacterium]
MNQKQFNEICQQLQKRKDDIRPSDAVTFPEPLRSALNFAIRIGRISLTDLAKMLELEVDNAKQIAELLVARNLLRVAENPNLKEIFYETRLSSMTRPMTRPPLDLWKKIDDDKK